MATLRVLALYKSLGVMLLVSPFAWSDSPLRANEPSAGWLRGLGEDLEICLRGEVLESDGSPAEGLAVVGALQSRGISTPIGVLCESNRFEACLPVNITSWYSMRLRVASNSGGVAYVKLAPGVLRQSAIDGLRVTLTKPTRRVAVNVEQAGSPVAGAKVRVDLGYGVELETETDAQGVAFFDLLSDQELSSFTAWTDDHRVGGFQFSRKPTRNPDDDTHVIELFDCRDQTIRFLDLDGKPVEGLTFEFHVATPSPNYNYIGLVGPKVMTTDARGATVFRWLPDWETHHFYPQLVDGAGWVLEGESSDYEQVEGTIVYRVKPAAKRVSITGRVDTPEAVEAKGFFVQLRSFQGEQEGHSDPLSAFADERGEFSVDVLPGATYCAYVNDEKWTGRMIDLVPYEPATDRVSEIVLPVSEGEEVRFSVTRGPQRLPYQGLTISLRENHSYTWSEDSKQRHGTGSRDRWLTTDESGHAVAHVMPGQVEASVFQPLWRVEEEIQIREGEPAKVTLHREREAPLSLVGRLVLAGGAESNLAGAEVRFGSVDGVYDYAGATTADVDGRFSFESLGNQIGVFAVTADQKAAGAAVVTDLGHTIEVKLKPTVEFRGHLLGENDEPVAGNKIRALVRVKGDEDYKGRFVKSIGAAEYRTVTNDRGEFAFENLPLGIGISLRTDNLPGEESRFAYLGEVYLNQDESRPPAVYRLERRRRAESTETLAERFAKRLRDARLSGYHFMVIACVDQDHLADFVQRNFCNYGKNPTVSRYVQLPVYLDSEGEGAALLEKHGWSAPEGDDVHAWALDGDGAPLGELVVDAANEASAAKAAEFVKAHIPVIADAEEKWNQAFADAEATNRKVWARISGRYCGPCFMLTRWIDDQRQLLEKDYVFLKIERNQDKNGSGVADRVTRGNSHGIPFFALFAPNGELVEESVGPLGNIGYPGSFESKNRFREMLLGTRKRLTDEEIDQLIDSL